MAEMVGIMLYWYTCSFIWYKKYVRSTGIARYLYYMYMYMYTYMYIKLWLVHTCIQFIQVNLHISVVNIKSTCVHTTNTTCTCINYTGTCTCIHIALCILLKVYFKSILNESIQGPMNESIQGSVVLVLFILKVPFPVLELFCCCLQFQ